MRFKKIRLKDGMVLVPKDFITVKETLTPSAKYAGVVAEKNGTLPHFVFLSEKPINEMKGFEEEEILKKCAKLYPKVNEVLANEVSARYDENGDIINATEWLKSPRLGIFGINDVKDKKELYLNTGIIRRK